MPRRDSAEPVGAIWRLETIHPRVIALTHLARRITAERSIAVDLKVVGAACTRYGRRDAATSEKTETTHAPR
jgi:hypothetical protein